MKFNTLARSALGLVVFLLLGGCTNSPDRPATIDTLPECGWLPNCVNTQSGRGGQSSEPIIANAKQWEQLKSWMGKQQDWDISIDEKYFVQAVVKTPLMRFRDDVQLLFLADSQLVHVRSSSRLGISDLGANAKRVETLRNQLTTQIE